MSARTEFERRLATAKATVKTLQSQVTRLEDQKASALADGNSAKAADINRQLRGLKEQLDDAWITRKACESRISMYKENAPKAAELRAKIASNWDQMRERIGQLGALQDQFRDLAGKLMPEIGRYENEIRLLDGQHFLLVGEPANAPTYQWPREAREFLAPSAKLYQAPPWAFASVAEREAAAAKVEAKRKAAQEARAQIAIAQAPECQVCKKPMTLRRYAGNDGEARPGSGTWEYEHCYKMASKHIPETVLKSK